MRPVLRRLAPRPRSPAPGNDRATVTAANDAATFRPGDIVFIQQGAISERATIDSITGTTIIFRPNLANQYTGDTVRVADLIPGQCTVRVAATTGIEPGTYTSLTQGATTEARVVQAVERANNFITLAQGLANSYTMAAADAAVTLQTLEFTLGQHARCRR